MARPIEQSLESQHHPGVCVLGGLTGRQWLSNLTHDYLTECRRKTDSKSRYMLPRHIIECTETRGCLRAVTQLHRIQTKV
jgi:hypothetical protein